MFTHSLFKTDTVYIYQIPPLKSAKAGYLSADWPLENPIWTGSLEVVESEVQNREDTNNVECSIVLKDTKTDEVFAQAPYHVDGSGLTPVSDSSRYHAIRVQGDGGQTAILGLGFPDRSAGFDFNVALQDFRKHATPIEVSKKSYKLPDKVVDEPAAEVAIPILAPPPRRATLEEEDEEEDEDDDDFGDFVGDNQ
ncbi:hypothetical protein CJU89_5393 [Yarrowia sp. B02]|nr:hypothetical protein CJU89_5393 [Yarrowia sp. B02]